MGFLNSMIASSSPPCSVLFKRQAVEPRQRYVDNKNNSSPVPGMQAAVVAVADPTNFPFSLHSSSPGASRGVDVILEKEKVSSRSPDVLFSNQTCFGSDLLGTPFVCTAYPTKGTPACAAPLLLRRRYTVPESSHKSGATQSKLRTLLLADVMSHRGLLPLREHKS